MPRGPPRHRPGWLASRLHGHTQDQSAAAQIHTPDQNLILLGVDSSSEPAYHRPEGGALMPWCQVHDGRPCAED